MKVEILTTPDCSNCSVVEKMLDEMKIQYEVIDVTKKPEYLQKYPITNTLFVKKGQFRRVNSRTTRELMSNFWIS